MTEAFLSVNINMKKFFKFLVKTLATVFVILIITATCFCGYYGILGYKEYKNAIKETPIETKISEITSRDNFVKKDDLSQTYINAVIAVEDHNFYNHGAISFSSLTRAIVTNFRKKELVMGGSTITQQVAKNLYFTQEKTLTRKVAEMFMAIELEKHYDKDEIFEFYVNNIFFGSGYYCIYDASIGYYGVEPKSLTDEQATILAGVPNAPSVYSPDNNTYLTIERQHQVIDCMIKRGYLTKEQGEDLKIKQ
ncbi:MAG: glycosyl transferase [Ruminococcaceae bacterium]|nr:glycosyl transferase [Oscillospiraceae bacterium]